LNSRQFMAKIIEKWPAKVLSLAAALIISIFYRMTLIESRIINAPLRTETNDTLVPAASYSHFVRINIRGDSKAIYPISEEDIEPYIDLRGYAQEGVYQVPVQVRKKRIEIDAVEITTEPMEITVRLDKKLTRSISISPVFYGNVSEGYVLESYTITPSSVIAEGPESLIGTKTDFRTEEINLEGHGGDFSVMANIINDNPLIQIRGSGIVEFRGTVKRKPVEIITTGEDG